MGGYLKSVPELPGREGFRTGISLRASFGPSGLPKAGSSKSPNPGPSGDRFILFVSFPYFGRSIQKATLSLKSESVKLSDFKRLGVDVPDREPGVSEEMERDYVAEISVEQEAGVSVEKGEVLVHQAQYMLFDDSKLYVHAC